MFELSEEKTLLFSDDRSVKLTTHRLIQEDHQRRNQIMLEDFENYEIKTAHIGNYAFLTFALWIVTMYFLVDVIIEYMDHRGRQFFTYSSSYFLVFAAFLLAISLYFYTISRRYFLRVNGKYGFIEFRIVNPKKKSVQKFLDTLTRRSLLIKNQSVQKTLQV